uniref:T-cell immunomodulatory protein n=1 Tax=Setaria digitata TaxID=48799 RepID=A0A915PL04_9BILA
MSWLSLKRYPWSIIQVILCIIIHALCVSGKLKGRICGYGDMDRDLYTDIIVQDHDLLKTYFQNENGEFSESGQYINLSSSNSVSCAVGDFNGDSVPDILVSRKNPSGEKGYESIVYIFSYDTYKPVPLNAVLLDELAIMDINGDGISDVIGFLNSSSLFCQLGSAKENFSSCEKFLNVSDFIPYERFLHSFVDIDGDLSAEIIFGTKIDNRLKMQALKRRSNVSDFIPYERFLHSFVDIDGDLSAEIIFGTKIDNRLKMQALKRRSNELWELDDTLIADLPADSCPTNYFGAVLFADFDADGVVDIGLPCCADATCRKVVVINMWNHRIGTWQDFHITGLEGSDLVSKKDEGNVVFRVGDFSLDGYPDLIALVREKTQNPMILENVPCTDCISNASRRFELRTSPRLIQPADVSLGQIQLASFFDLKEDGTLDVLLEYKDADQSMAIDFIRCEDKGDTTFLKVQVFSSSCDQFCGSAKTKIGTGIAWHGACIRFSMSDSWGYDQVGSQCQMSQTTHRALHTPFALFGLGRSPNFVDYGEFVLQNINLFLHIGSPRVPVGLYQGNQHYYLKQIVPNSRLIVVPPKDDGVHWQSRLYLTPSQLIKQSLMVLVSVCMILLLVVVFLHYRERRADKHERQAQSHRFHFDAM